MKIQHALKFGMIFAAIQAVNPYCNAQGTFEIIYGQAFSVDGMSDDGGTIIGSTYYDEGWVWREGIGRIELPTPSGYAIGQARAISADGQYVAVRAANIGGPGRQALRYNVQTGTYEYGGLWNGTNSVDTWGMSADGQTLAVDIISGGVLSPGRWRVGSPMEIVHQNQNLELTFTFAISNTGELAGAKFIGTSRRAFYYSDNAGFQFLENPYAGSNSQAMAMTPDGHIVIGSAAGRAVAWINGTPSVLNTIDGISSMSAGAISADGSVIGGGQTQASAANIAWIWTMETGAIRLSDFLAARGFTNIPELNSVAAISSDKRIIVGRAGNNTYRVVFDSPIATITIPSPSTTVLFTFGVFAVPLRKRRR
ncbi:MAG: hypothetical protein U0640_03015 [Phycisphaerales bacterium]